MKKILLFLGVLLLFVSISSGCQKSEQEKIDAIRKEQDIEIVSNQQLIEHIVKGKEAFTGVFQSVDSEIEIADEFGIAYSPFKENYNSPEKIREELEKYYSKGYTETLLEMIPATYVDGRYSLPVGDMGMVPDYSKFSTVDRRDVDERNIELSYKPEAESVETYTAYFEYIDGDWKISDEIRKFD